MIFRRCDYCHKYLLPFQLVLIHKFSEKKLHSKCFEERENAFIKAIMEGNINEIDRIIKEGKKNDGK